MILRFDSLCLLVASVFLYVNPVAAQIVPQVLNSLDSIDKIQIRLRPIPIRNIIGHSASYDMVFLSGGAISNTIASAMNGTYCSLQFNTIGHSPLIPYSSFSLLNGGTTPINSGFRVQHVSTAGEVPRSVFMLNIDLEHGLLVLYCAKTPGDTSPFTDQDLVNIMGTETLQFVGNTIPYRSHGIVSPEQNTFIPRRPQPLPYSPEENHVLRPSTARPEPLYTGEDGTVAE